MRRFKSLTACYRGEFVRLPYEKYVKSGFKLATCECDSRINFVFSRITLSNSLWNSRMKTFLLLEFFSSGKLWSFYLHFKLDNLLYLTPKSVKLYNIFLHFVAFSSQISNGWAYSTPSYPLDFGTTLKRLAKFLWINSEKIIRTRETYKSNRSKTQ